LGRIGSRLSGQAHRSDPRILGRRTLARDHRRLVEFLHPGMSALDIGCGTGAITADIARAVGPAGRVVGLERDPSLVALARQEHGSIDNLRFIEGDVLNFRLDEQFDIVTAARTLQWISTPADAIARMREAAAPGGRVVVLDYNHEDNYWQPEPPVPFMRFYAAFLEWRRANGWDNRMADSLEGIFGAQGIPVLMITDDNEIARRGDPGTAIWTRVVETLGATIVAAGFLTEAERIRAEAAYREWAQDKLESQTLRMRTICGYRPPDL
jgi:SAM-dependent methyltransferase